MTVAELETLRNEIDILRKVGRTKKQLQIIQHNRDIDEQRDTLVQAVLRGEKLEEDIEPKIKSTAEKGKIKKGYRFARAFTSRQTCICHGAGFQLLLSSLPRKSGGRRDHSHHTGRSGQTLP